MLRRYLFITLVICALAAVIIPYLGESYGKFLSTLNRQNAIPKKPTKPQFLLKAVNRQNEVSPSTKELLPLKAWLIGVGNFNTLIHAQQWVDKLHALGYPAFMQQNQGQFEIYVGPIIKNTEAQNLMLEIREKTGVKGMLLTYTPIHKIKE